MRFAHQRMCHLDNASKSLVALLNMVLPTYVHDHESESHIHDEPATLWVLDNIPSIEDNN